MASKSRSIDITGQKFGKLVAIRLDHKRYNYQEFWKFRCDCGNTVVTSKNPVKRGSVSSCGCIRRKDITGQRFNMLTAIRFDHIKDKKNGTHYWLFKCDCGNEKIMPKSSVVSGKTKTCGCSKKTGGVFKMARKKELTSEAEYKVYVAKLESVKNKIELTDLEISSFSILAGLVLKWERKNK